MEFVKMSGSGNDFIIIDNRTGVMSGTEAPAFVKKVCRRAVSVGADGLILIEPSSRADFAWRFYNSDGGEVEMCGNGSRCAARFAFEKGIAGERLSFETLAGIIEAEIKGRRVKVKMPDPEGMRLNFQLPVDGKAVEVSYVRMGVPHVVIIVENLEDFDVIGMGRKIRYHEAFQPEGANANFIFPLDGEELLIRTYERGVEDETLACGTGSIAAALITAAQNISKSPVDVQTRGGEILTIHFDRQEKSFYNVYLEGEARFIYTAELNPEAI